MPERPDIVDAFYHYLNTAALEADRLYILGDFFEYWTGDDDITPFSQLIIKALRSYKDKGKEVFFMPGNRDFLVGNNFYKLTGSIELLDPSIIRLGSIQVVLLHGDSLCTQDRGYMLFRRITRNKVIQFIYRNMPKILRVGLADKLRQASKKSTSLKKQEIMDVCPEAVESLLQKSGCQVMIHGHTHRPFIHDLVNLSYNDTGEVKNKQRIVLGDWDKLGWYLTHKAGQFDLKSFAL